MDNWFRSKWFVRGVSLAFAVLFFVFVNVEVNDSQSELRFFGGSEDSETVTDVDVDIEIDSDNYVVRGVPETVDMTLTGSKSVITQTIQLEKYKAFVDLRGLEEGDHTVEMEYTNIPSELEVFFEPKNVDVTIEERSSKEFPVTVEFSNTDDLPAGFELGEAEVNPDTVTVTSSKSVIEQIGHIKAYVDVDGLTESVDNREVPVIVYDNQGNELRVTKDPENVVVSVDVHNPSKKVPLDISTSGELPDGYSLVSSEADIEEVEIFGTSDVLDGIDSISTEDIPLDDMKESGTVEASLNLPDGVTVENEDPIEVTFEIEQTKTVDDIPIDIENSSDGQDISFVDPEEGEMDVKVVGDSNDIEELTKEDIKMAVDVSELDPGEHDVDVSLKGPDGVDITGEKSQVTVDVGEEETTEAEAEAESEVGTEENSETESESEPEPEAD